jgi:hypothetical protein
MKLKTIIILAVIVLMLYGCGYIGNKLPQMTPQEERWNITDMITELTAESNQTISITKTGNISAPKISALQPKDGRFENIMEVDCNNGLCKTKNCIVDYKIAPEMQSFAKKVAAMCEIEFPKIKERIRNPDVKMPPKFVFNKTLEKGYAGIETGDKIYLNAEYFAKNPTDLGAIVHEMVHSAQNYYGDYPMWACEGIADYTRSWLGYNEWGTPRCSSYFPNYTSGYDCAAALFQYIEREYDQSIVTTIDEAMRHERYTDSLFEYPTGKTLEELWLECREKDCKYAE